MNAPAPAVPVRTALGREELQRRTRRLQQRHRTVLLLVDGRRTLADLLQLSLQAGATTAHFEDLVRGGFVELPLPVRPATDPVEVAQVAEPLVGDAAVVDTTAGAADDTRPMAAGGVPPSTPVATTGPAPPSEPDPAEPQDAPHAAAAGAPTPTPTIDAPAEPEPEPAPVAALPPAVAPAGAAPGVTRSARSRVPPEAPRQGAAAVAPVPALTTVHVPPGPSLEPLLEQARQALLDCLAADAQPGGTRLAGELRRAENGGVLIELAWRMDRGLAQHRRSRRGLLALQRARELLGLGNTQFTEESRPGGLGEA